MTVYTRVLIRGPGFNDILRGVVVLRRGRHTHARTHARTHTHAYTHVLTGTLQIYSRVCIQRRLIVLVTDPYPVYFLHTCTLANMHKLFVVFYYQ